MPKVSIIIPVYNGAHTIEACLDSLRAQEGLDEPPEIIVVDDGSTDGTPEVVKRYEGVRLLHQENAGAGPARNTGTAVAQGDYLLYTDADCVAAPDWAASIIKGFLDDDIALVMGRTTTCHGLENIYAKTQAGRDLCGHDKPGPTDRCNSNNMAMRPQHAKMLPFDKALRRGQDSDIGWRVWRAGLRMHYWPDAIIDHRHVYRARSFFRNGYIEGRGTAQLHYKHGKWMPRDLAPFFLSVASFLLTPLTVYFAYTGLFFFLLFLAALMFNELYFKKKTIALSILTFPVQCAWYVFRIAGYTQMTTRILLRLEPEIAESKRQFKAFCENRERGK